MCGIVGAVAERKVAPLLLEGLQRLEYRGYDSSGIATCSADRQLHRLRAVGAVGALAGVMSRNILPGGTGIAHTRWATHGAPSELNAHPHMSGGRIAVVHNGIIENAGELREQLLAAGYTFESQTDTEVIAHLVHQALEDKGNDDVRGAVRRATEQLQGQFAIAVVSIDHPDCLVVARQGCPLIIGLGDGENYIASDAAALLPLTRRMVYLEEGDFAEVTRHSVHVYDRHGVLAERAAQDNNGSAEAVERGDYRHFMQKEIFEQAAALERTLGNRVSPAGLAPGAFDERTREMLRDARAVHIVACGTSYHAAMTARYLIERFARIPCTAEQASEYRYRSPVAAPGTLLITVSQSGETADTLAALRMAKQGNYCGTLAVCNVGYSSLARESEAVFMTAAGPEIGVASTKAFTTQLLALMMITLGLAREQESHGLDIPALCRQLLELPNLIEQTLRLDEPVRQLAARITTRSHALFIARGVHFPIALEGALKLKEISYIHAEAYPAGELKHGPLALVDSNMPVIAIAPNDRLLDKVRSNIQEVQARGGEMFVLCDAASAIESGDGVFVLHVPQHHGSLVNPFLYTVPLQLLAYHVAVLRGTDVDKPRNLAKSVTVE